MQNFSVYVHMEQVVTICCGFNVWTWPWFQVANCCGFNIRFRWGFNVWIGRWFYVEIPRWLHFHFQLQINTYPTSTSDVDSTWIPLQILMRIQRLNRTLIPRWNPTLIPFSFSPTNQHLPNVNIRRGFHFRFWCGFNVWIGRWFHVEIPRWFNFHFQLQINTYPTSISDVDSTSDSDVDSTSESDVDSMLKSHVDSIFIFNYRSIPIQRQHQTWIPLQMPTGRTFLVQVLKRQKWWSAGKA